MSYIEKIVTYIPKTSLKITDCFEQFGLTESEMLVFKKMYGINQIPIADKESTVELLGHVYNKLKLSQASKEIKLVIHAHTMPQLLPFACSAIQEFTNKINDLKEVLVFGSIVGSCSSLIAAFNVASIFLEKHKSAKVLVLVGERAISNQYRLIPNVAIVGDAMAGVLLSKVYQKENILKIIGLKRNYFGKYSRGIWVESSVHLNFEKDFPHLLHETVMDLLLEHQIDISQIRLFIPHNVNIMVWKKLCNMLNIGKNRMFLDNINKFGHCFGVDIIINCESIIRDKLLKKGDYVVCMTTGIGTVVGVCLLQAC